MARQRRLLKKNASYHTIATINRFEDAFQQDMFKEMFLIVLMQAKKKYKFYIRNFCVLPNNVQFIIQPLEDESLSKIMQWILSVFARRYNRANELKGHLFLDRFKSTIIADPLKYLNIYDEISNYPVNEKLSNSAIEYKFGGLYFIIRKIFDIVEPPQKVFIYRIIYFINKISNKLFSLYQKNYMPLKKEISIRQFIFADRFPILRTDTFRNETGINVVFSNLSPPALANYCQIVNVRLRLPFDA